MSSLDEKLHQAVTAALNPGSHQAEGLEFLQQVRQSPHQAWEPGLVCFLAGSAVENGGNKGWAYKYPGETRLFGLQLVDAMLQLTTSSDEERALVDSCSQTVRHRLWEYIHREFVEGPGEVGLSYLRNKLVQTMFLLFFRSYPATWPDFFLSFAALLRQHPSSPDTQNLSGFNPRTTDLYLRLLHEISAELSDALLRLNRPQSRLARDAELRDAVRENDAAQIAKETFGIVAESLHGLSQNVESRVGLTGKVAQECLEMGIRVVEDYVSWIDISLIVTPTWIPFLYQALRLPHLSIRLAAADALICIVTKGMPAPNKIHLYDLLGLVDVLQALRSEILAKQQTAGQNDDDEQFSERLGKILNGMGVELCKICDDNSAPLETRSSSLAMASQLLPLLLSFVEDDVFASCSAVLPFSSAMLSRYKKDKKLSLDSHMSPEKSVFLSQLLQRVVSKLQFPADDIFEWEPPVLPGETEDDDMAAFLDRRRQLKIVIDGVATIDERIYQDIIDPLISSLLDKTNSGAPSVSSLSWQEAEFAMYLLYNYGEALKASTGHWSYVQVPAQEIKKKTKNRDYKINYSQYPLSALGMLLLNTSKSTVTSFPHPSVALQWFECVVRYHDFFEIFPAVIQDVLPAFLDERGLHNPNPNIRARCCYLFYRFVLLNKAVLQTNLTLEELKSVIDHIQDLVVISVEVPTDSFSGPVGSGSDVLVKVVLTPSVFDSQLYLFEAIGVIIASGSREPKWQTMYLNKILEPLVNGMQIQVPTPLVVVSDLAKVLAAHHRILAVGAVAKGFPHLPSNPSASGFNSAEWPTVFKGATDGIMHATKALNDVRIVRDAARSSFHKIVATIGMEALSHVPTLIDCLLEKLTQVELVEFLSFVGQLNHKYKDHFVPLLDSLLLPLVSKIIVYLDQPITGTDDIVSQSELRRAYFSLFNSIINTQMHMVFISSNNKPHLEQILNTVIQQMQGSEVLLLDLRGGLNVLRNLSTAWLKPIGSVEPVPVPGFEMFLYNQAIPLCFAIPTKPRFDWSDAEAYLVMGEIAALLKILSSTRGDEFNQFLIGNFLPSISCPPEKASQLIQGIQSMTDVKPSRKPLVEFFGRADKK